MDKDYLDIEVTDKRSFSEFAGLLLKDFRANSQEWENNRLELFLEAIQAYTEDLDGFYQNNHPKVDPELPTWSTFADILRGAVVYE